jgi:hypothetical protein
MTLNNEEYSDGLKPATDILAYSDFYFELLCLEFGTSIFIAPNSVISCQLTISTVLPFHISDQFREINQYTFVITRRHADTPEITGLLG